MRPEPEPAFANAAALARKVRWEGGLTEALEYGIGYEDIGDPDLADAWAKLQDAYNVLRPLLDGMRRRLAMDD